MDALKYKKYVRDVGITDEDFLDLFTDVYDEICRRTRIFKEHVGFELSSCEETYDFKALYELHNALNQNVINSIDVVTNTDDKDLDAQAPTYDIKCETDNKVEIKTETSNAPNKFIALDDVVFYDEYQRSYSFLQNYMDHLYEWTYKYNWSKLLRAGYQQNPDKPWKIPVIATYTIIPNQELVDDEMEALIKSALIAGIQYYANSMYMNQNEQITDMSLKRYEMSILQVQNSMPTINTLAYEAMINKFERI
jgi:hypothetical protein